MSEIYYEGGGAKETVAKREEHVDRIWVDLQPVGRRIAVARGTTLLAAAQQAGVEIAALCGGAGSCGKCRVQLMSGELAAPTANERRFFDKDELQAGYRLACQAPALTDVKFNIPPESLSTPQRLQVEGQETEIKPDPAVRVVDLVLDCPSLDDLRSDTTRLADALVKEGLGRPVLGQAVLNTLSDELRVRDWSVRLALHRRDTMTGGIVDFSRGEATPGGYDVVGMLSSAETPVGFAVDIGTTKMAGYLIDLETGLTLAKDGRMNPQIAYGEDVLSRIAYANEHAAQTPNGRVILQRSLVGGVDDLLGALCHHAGINRSQVVDAVVVGNTVIHHLFAGLPVEQLGAAPYIAALSEPLSLEAERLGLGIAPGARIYMPPNIAGYVGADHVAMLLATEAWQAAEPTIALDIGTNTEISLALEGRVLSCSCASGPAFEGAHIHAGMRAAPGAVEYVQIEGDQLRVQTIEGRPAVGICGSGILDVVAQLRAAGVVGPTGRLKHDHKVWQSRMVQWDGGGAFRLVDKAATGNGHDLVVTRQDVNEIQLAKGAIRAGVEVLLDHAGLTYSDLRAFIVAGAFGTYLDIKSAISIGMFPSLPLSRFQQVGNAAGTGARQMLISTGRRRVAESIVGRIHYIELTAQRSFTDFYMEAMVL
jgi:uncharacterized 2Fe-2S/4Fe-4S cluster protein (DUF4445 family)